MSIQIRMIDIKMTKIFSFQSFSEWI